MENTCFNCSANIPNVDNLFYCPMCITQVKCKKCSEKLLKDAIGCVSCGLILEINFKEDNKSSALNQIEFEQKGDTKKFKATFTDNVGHELVATFGGMVGITMPKKRLFSINSNKNPNPLEIGTSFQEIEDVDLIDDENLSEALNRIFRIDGDNLIFQTANFKSKNKLNNEKRIALLTLLGYKYIHNAEEIKRQLLTDVLNKFKYNSGTFRTWIGKSEEIGQKSGGLIFLTPNGLETAIEILKEVVNPTITEGIVNLSKGSSSGSKKKNSDSSSDKKNTKGPKEFILQLIQESYFAEHRTVSDIAKYLKVNKAANFTTPLIGTALGRLLGKNGLKREQGTKGYEYFI